MSLRDQIKKILREYSNEKKVIKEIDNIDVSIPQDSVAKKIADKIEPGLPLNKYGNTSDNNEDRVNSILTLQKTLVDLGYNLGNSGIDGDGVDGYFGNNTEKGVKSFTNGDTELNVNNMETFETELFKQEDTLTSKNTISSINNFIPKFNSLKGTKESDMNICKVKTNYENVPFVVKTQECYTVQEMADAISETFTDISRTYKASILSVMIKEQGRGDHICAPNNNFAGIQTDSGKWGNLDSLISGQYCTLDAERVRSFASFDTLSDGLQFIKDSFKKKGWVDLNSNDGENKTFDVNQIADENAKLWQTQWNLKLNDTEFDNFKKYGYNPRLKSEDFTDKKGIYIKSLDELTPEELEKHKSNIEVYRSPEKISDTLLRMNKLFKRAYNLIK